MKRAMRAGVIGVTGVVGALLAPAWAMGQGTGGAPAGQAPAGDRPGESVAVVRSAPSGPAAEFLLRLENAGKGLKTLQANLRRTRFFPDIEGGGKQEWQGRLIYDTSLSTPESPVRRFQINFEFTVRDGNIRNNDRTSWIFDGQWLTEINPEAKQMHRRQITPPGQRIDPLALGEGAFPLPIGQQRDKILERFDAELLAPDRFDHFQGGTFPDALKDTQQLKLVPKAGREEGRRLTEVRLWYRTADLLPRMAWTSEPDGSSNEYFLWALETNKPLPAGAFDVTPQKGWTVQVDAFKADAPAEEGKAEDGKSDKPAP
jgi:hypothetical protein